jgi:deoxyxylulose-5-phosphate synthase
VKSIKTRRKPSSNTKTFWVNYVSTKKNEKNSGDYTRNASGSSLKFMMDALPERAFDVGIAEQRCYAVSWNGEVWLFFATSTHFYKGV